MFSRLATLLLIPALIGAWGCSGAPTVSDAIPKDNTTLAQAEEQRPAGEVFTVQFRTSKGQFDIEVHPEWAPRGAARFKELVEAEYFDGCRFFRVVEDFVVQWGLNGDPEVTAKWQKNRLKDEPVVQSNKKGYITFAMGGPNSRTTQVFINLTDNSGNLDQLGFAPFGKVTAGLDVVESLYAGYGEELTQKQGEISKRGNSYLEQNYPNLDLITSARIAQPGAQPAM